MLPNIRNRPTRLVESRSTTADVGAASFARRPHRSSRLHAGARAGWLLSAPAILFIAVFVLFPLGFAVYISLTDWPLIGSYHFIGLGNYVQLGSDATFVQSVLFTLKYTAIVTLPILLVGYGLALLVRSNRPGAIVFRTVFFLPYVVGLATESYMLVLELQPDSGAVNFLLSRLGIAKASTAWLVDANLALIAVSVLVVWFASGLTMVLLMAGMQGVPRELYESAEIDGASWWDKELHVTLPLLRGTIALSLIISVIGSFLAFTQFYILTQGGPGTSTDTVVMWIYQVGFVQLRLGEATAMSLVLMVVVGLISIGQFIFLRAGREEGQ